MVLVDKEVLVPFDKPCTVTIFNISSHEYEEPYVSPLNTAIDDSTSSEDEFTPYYYNTGELIESKTYDNLVSVGWESDYEEINGSCTVKLPKLNKEDMNLLIKGNQCSLRVARIHSFEELEELLLLDEEIHDQALIDLKNELMKMDETIELSTSDLEKMINPEYNIPEVFTGFLDDYNLSKDGLEITANNWGVLLEQKGSVEFSQQKRSVILEEVIKLAGLVPHVDLYGLPDDVIDYTSKSTGSGDDSGEALLGEGDDRTTYDLCVAHGLGLSDCNPTDKYDSLFKPFANKNRAYYKKARSLGSAKAVIGWFRSNFSYGSYCDNRDSDPDVTFNANCKSRNCADSNRLLACMLQSIGVKTVLVHGSPYNGTGHYWCFAKKGDKWLPVDTCYTSRASTSGNSTNMWGV